MSPPSVPPGRLDRVVVIGAGMAGLLAARVLADHADQVLVVDRSGSGVVQQHHPHVLLHSGLDALGRLFPGLTTQMRRHGAEPFDWGMVTTQLPDGVRAGRFATGFRLWPIARVALEALVRRRVEALDNVSVIPRFRVVDFLWADDLRAVTAVAGRWPDGTTGSFAADLVVDASGRNTATPRLVGRATGAVVPARTIEVPLCYSSATFDCPGGRPADFAAFYEPVYAPTVRRGSLVLPIGEGRWMVGLVGVGERVPVDDAGFLAFAGSLQSPMVAEFLRAARRTSPRIHRFVQPRSRWFRYERMRSWPARLLALGDAVCVTNPVYGQGMTLAALQAMTLGRLLPAYGAAEVARPFQREVARLLRYPWLLAYNADRHWLAGGRSPGADLVRWYMQKLLDHAVHDPHLFRRLMPVQQLVETPLSLVSPATTATLAACAVRDRLAPHRAGGDWEEGLWPATGSRTG